MSNDTIMHLLRVPVGMLQVNCYVIWNKATRETLIIDPGADAEAIASIITKHDLEPAGILLTHGHVDHIGAIPDLVECWAIPVYVHPGDRPLYESPDNAVPPWLPAVKDLPEPVDTVPAVTGLDFTVIHTPGHTPGGVCYYAAGAATLFAGDTLFQRSVGRTDLPGGDADTLTGSIREHLLQLPPDVTVYPGHGPPTTIGEELRHNPFLDIDPQGAP